MKFIRFLGALLCVIGCIIALAGILATALPLINNEQVNSIISSFSIASANPLINLINKAALFCINYHYYVFGGGVLLLLCGGLIHTAADNKINKDLFLDDDDSLFEPNPATPKPAQANTTEEWTVEQHLASTEQTVKKAAKSEPAHTALGSILDLNEPDDATASDQLTTSQPVAAYMPKPSAAGDTQIQQSAYYPILASRDASGLDQSVSYDNPTLDTQYKPSQVSTQQSALPDDGELPSAYTPATMNTPSEDRSVAPTYTQQESYGSDIPEPLSSYDSTDEAVYTAAPAVPTYGKRQRTLIFPDIPKKGEISHFKVTETSYYPAAAVSPTIKNHSPSLPAPASRPKETEMVSIPTIPQPVYTTTPKAPERVVFASVQADQSQATDPTGNATTPTTATWDFPASNNDDAFVAIRPSTSSYSEATQNTIAKDNLATQAKPYISDDFRHQTIPATSQPASAKFNGQTEDILVTRSPREVTINPVQPPLNPTSLRGAYSADQHEQAASLSQPSTVYSPTPARSQSTRPRIVSTMGKKSAR